MRNYICRSVTEKIFFHLKNITFFSFVLICFTIEAQILISNEIFQNNSYQFDIRDWDLEKIGNNYELRQFDDPSAPGKHTTLIRDVFIAIPFGQINKLEWQVIEQIQKISNPYLNSELKLKKDGTYEKHEIKELIYSNEETGIRIKGYLWLGNNYCVHLQYNGIIYDFINRTSNSIISAKLKFYFNEQIPNKNISPTDEIHSLILNKNSALKWTGKPEYDYIINDDWIEYGRTYIKIGVSESGIYRILYSDLNNFNVSPNTINPKTLKILKKGKQIPIFVNGEDDFSFDENDFIEFVGTKNLGGKHKEVNKYGEPYNEYLDRYSDTTVYWLTWGGDEGKRSGIFNSPDLTSSYDTVKMYKNVLHIERNPWFDYSADILIRREMPYWIENKTWGWRMISVGRTPINFNVDKVIQEDSCTLWLKLQSYASNVNTKTHEVAISLNNSNLSESTFIDRYKQAVISSKFSSDILKNEINTFNIHSKPTESSINALFLDWVEIEYPRRLSSVNNSLIFSLTDIPVNSPNFINVENFSNDSIVVWAVGGESKRMVSEPENGNITFYNKRTNADKYYLTTLNKINHPKFYYKREFRKLDQSDFQADYLVITHRKFFNQANQYCQFIKSAYNLNTQIIDIDEIYDLFSYGFFNPETIKEFLIMTHTKWSAPSPRFVFLIGGCTYDYHHNKSTYLGEPYITTYVPSFGSPVSDNWFVSWDTTGIYAPNMKIGRLPVTENSEFEWYLNKHKEYLSRRYDLWNKSFLFFSGGLGDDENELNLLKSTNQKVIDDFVKNAPIGGKYTHFYKTINPSTNFGPVGQSDFQNAINQGGLFISYLGHSGTRIWDNSITEPGQLSNGENKYPLITDFGCSTARFAEPDVKSFSEMFVLSKEGESIAYIGNTSLGFITSSTRAPIYFYRNLLTNNNLNIASALDESKFEMILNHGNTQVQQLFNLTNTLIGDPVLNIALPQKSNFIITAEDIIIREDELFDNKDSLQIKMFYSNYGSVFEDSIKIGIVVTYNNERIFSRKILRQCPLLRDSILFKIPVFKREGMHLLSVTLDVDNEIVEIFENDNTIEFPINILNTAIRLLAPNKITLGLKDKLIILNPSTQSADSVIQIKFSKSPDFKDYILIKQRMDSFYTPFDISMLDNNHRYFFKANLLSEANTSISASFLNNSEYYFNIFDSLSFSSCRLQNMKYSGDGIEIDSSETSFRVQSAGWSDGNLAFIFKDGQNFIPFAGRGHNICVFKDKTYEFLEYKYFDLLFGGTAARDGYIEFLDSLDSDKWVLIAVADEGYVSSVTLRNKIKQFGSSLIDKLVFRGSWALIGKKGAISGSVPEAVSKPYEGGVQIDTSFAVPLLNAALRTKPIGPTGGWKKIFIKDIIPDNSQIQYFLLNEKPNNEDDTLSFRPGNGLMDMSNIDSEINKNLVLYAELNKDFEGGQTKISSVQIDYKLLAELGLNYQVVSTEKDTIVLGKSNKLKFWVYNSGEIKADSFRIKVELLMPNNKTKLIKNFYSESLDSMSRKYYEVDYISNVEDGWGEMAFNISVDTEQKFSELFEDNNFYSEKFFIAKDSIVTSVSEFILAVTFDGVDINDGDYVSQQPEIIITLLYSDLRPVTDSSSITLTVNGIRVPYNDFIVDHKPNENKINYIYHPALEDGDYVLRLYLSNIDKKEHTIPGYQKYFLVSSRLKIINVYNYPNPFSEKTNFTFRLTRIPQELSIKIYTVTGRLIKEIKANTLNLKTDFNFIVWDGKDNDGDQVANGIYLYKIILRDKDQTFSVTHKLAIVR